MQGDDFVAEEKLNKLVNEPIFLDDSKEDEIGFIGIDAILDDRDISIGSKFKDFDLIGFPISLTCGKNVYVNQLEVKIRKTKEIFQIPETEVISFLQSIIKRVS